MILSYHLKRPDPPDPDLELSLNAFNVIQINTFPPAASGWLPPEQQQFLCHAYSVGIRSGITADVGTEAGKGDAADDSFLWFAGAVAPLIVVVETAARRC